MVITGDQHYTYMFMYPNILFMYYNQIVLKKMSSSSWPPSIQMGVAAGIFLASILLKEMRYLVYTAIYSLGHLCPGEYRFRLTFSPIDSHKIEY